MSTSTLGSVAHMILETYVKYMKLHSSYQFFFFCQYSMWGERIRRNLGWYRDWN